MDADRTRRDNRIDIDGGSLFVEQAGAGGDLLFVHSGITDSRMWDDQFDVLASRFRATRYDLRGFGQSSAVSGPYSHVDDLARVVETLALRRPHVVAASMGARVTVDLALRSPGIFDRMLLVGPAVSGFGFDDPALRACWTEMTDAWDAGDVEKTIDIETRCWINGPNRTQGAADEAVLERVREMQRLIYAAAPDDDPEIEADVPAAGRLAELTVPILVVVGEHDASDIHRNAEALLNDAARAAVAVLLDTGHLPNMEAVEEFNRLTLECLA